MVLQNLYGDNLIGSLFPAFGNLTKSAAAKELQNFILKFPTFVSHIEHFVEAKITNLIVQRRI
jgi:hypothetical protein